MSGCEPQPALPSISKPQTVLPPFPRHFPPLLMSVCEQSKRRNKLKGSPVILFSSFWLPLFSNNFIMTTYFLHNF